uniref:Retrotransposon gag domain-containing protein n=1 Tax=Ananas comosus var. bracteatus TaxID=296719 RepID=A0A6V7QN56_ANACO|nr:unnamed protein product [Ananas comosus var. bracteatus]
MPVTVPHIPTSTLPMDFGSSGPDLATVKVEKERVHADLTTFTRFNHSTFDWELKQGSCSVSEYEREFSYIVNCVLGVVQRGLRPEIFRVVHSFKLQTFVEILDLALW